MENAPRLRRGNNDALLAQIVTFCQRAGMAESTFGRRAVNDGKFVPRLRFGGRVTTQTVERVLAFIHEMNPRGNGEAERPFALPTAFVPAPVVGEADVETRFRFYDNRQKYLLFVSTCTEKQVVAQRIGMELDSLMPRPPALRVFDAGCGDGTVLMRVMRSMHDRFPTVPFYIVGK